jgi:hypothetical protein
VPGVVPERGDAHDEQLELVQDRVHVRLLHLVRDVLEDVDRMDPVVVWPLVVDRAEFVQKPEEHFVGDLKRLQNVELIENEIRDFEQSDAVPLDGEEVEPGQFLLLLPRDDKLD